MNFYEALGSVLKEYRESQERSLSWVAQKAGISVSGYRCIEQGKSKAPLDKIEHICAVYNVTLQTLLKDVIKKM